MMKYSMLQWVKFVTLTVVSLLVCNPNSLRADNWTRFRGPNGTGNAGKISFPATWTEQDYQWKVQLSGIGHSSPVGWGERLFVTSGNADSGSTTLACLHADSGKTLWEREFKGEPYSMHLSNSYASTTPAIDEQHVYLTWAAGGAMQCVAITHAGDEVWRTQLGKFEEAHGFAASPVVVDGVVCLQIDHTEDAFVVGLDAASGDVRWRVERPVGKASYATPCVVGINGHGAAVISQSMTGGMQAIEVQTGQQLWQLADVFPARCVSSPLLVDNLVLGACGGGGSGKVMVGIELPNGPDSEPTQRFELSKNVPYVPTPVMAGQLLFLWHDQGRVACVELTSDQEAKLLWTKRIGGKYFGSPIVAGDKIYCLSSEGQAVVLAADREFAVLGENALGGPTFATPSVHQSKMYLRTETTLACLPAE